MTDDFDKRARYMIKEKIIGIYERIVKDCERYNRFSKLPELKPDA